MFMKLRRDRLRILTPFNSVRLRWTILTLSEAGQPKLAGSAWDEPDRSAHNAGKVDRSLLISGFPDVADDDIEFASLRVWTRSCSFQEVFGRQLQVVPAPAEGQA